MLNEFCLYFVFLKHLGCTDTKYRQNLFSVFTILYIKIEDAIIQCSIPAVSARNIHFFSGNGHILALSTPLLTPGYPYLCQLPLFL